MKLLLYIAPLLFLLGLTGASPPNFRYHFCTDTVLSSTAAISYHSNLNSLLSFLSSNSTRTRYYGSSSSPVTASGQTIQGLYQCRGDLSLENCKDCVLVATNDILQRCPNNTGAVIWYDECMLRFSNDSIFSFVSTTPAVYLWNPGSVAASERVQFNSFVRTVLNDRIAEAATEKSSFVAVETSMQENFTDVDQIYSMVQCTENLSADDCQGCLQQAIMRLPSCCNGTKGGRVLFPSCFFRYESSLFYNTSGVVSPPPPPPVHQSGSEKSGISTAVIVAIVASVGVSILLFCVGICFFRRRRARKLHQHYSVNEETACNSSVRSDSPDYPLLVSNGTYVLTANNCVKCTCSSSSNWTLQCELSGLKPSSWSSCPAMQCAGAGSLNLGNTTTSSCRSTTCAYAGFSSNQTISTTLISTSTCPSMEILDGREAFRGSGLDHG